MSGPCFFQSPVSSFSAAPLGVIAQVHQDSTCACKTECGQEWSLVCCKYGRSIPFTLLVFGLVPSRFLLHTVVHDVGPEGSAPNNEPEGPAADDKPGGPGADDKLDRFNISCALVPVEPAGDIVEPARVPVISFLFRTCA